MPVVGPSLRGTASASSTLPGALGGRAFLSPSPSTGLLGNATVDTEYGDQVQPRGGVSQIVGLALWVDGWGTIQPRHLIGGVTVERSREGGATCSFAMRGDHPLLGTEVGWGGSPPGKREIQVWACYVTSQGPKWRKYVSGLLSDTSSRSVAPYGEVSVMTVNCLDPKYRYGCKKINYIRDLGHGSNHEQVVREILIAQGVPSVSISNGSYTFNGQVQIDSQTGMPTAEELANAVNKVVYFDRDGTATLLHKGKRSNRTPDLTIADTDILGGGFTVDGVGGEVPTQVIVTGERIVKDEECGRETRVYLIDIYKAGTVIPGTSWKQASNGLLSEAAGVGLGAVDDIVLGGKDSGTSNLWKRTLRTEEWECGTMLSERIEEWGWKNPLSYRYSIQNGVTTLTINGYAQNVYIYESDAVQDDGYHAYLWPRARLTKTSDSYRVFEFEEREKTLEVTETDGNAEGLGVKEPVEALVQERQWTAKWHQRRAALKNGSQQGTNDWNATNYMSDRVILGDGKGVEDHFEAFRGNHAGMALRSTAPGNVSVDGDYPRYEEVVYEVTALAKLEGKTSSVYEPVARPGGQYWYEENVTSRDAWEGVGWATEPANEVESVVEVYTASEDSGRTTVATTTKLPTAFENGSEQDRIEHSDGGLPEATLKQDPQTNTETQRFERTVPAPALLASHIECERDISNPWIEDEQQAEEYGYAFLADSSALPCSGRMAANIPLEPGMVARLEIRGHELFGKLVDIDAAGLNDPGYGEPILTTFRGKHYVI